MYIFMNENKIIPYNGDILKRYVGNRLMKTIANPTDEDLKEFGYKPLITTECPEEIDGYAWTAKYTESEDSIIQEWVKEKIIIV